MTQRVNVIISDENWRHLSAVPKGERSRLVNKAIAEYHRMQRRREAARRMDELSENLPNVAGSAEQWVRADRDSHR